MRARHAFWAIASFMLLGMLLGCASIAPEQAAVRDAALEMVADENAAQGATPGIVGPGSRVFVGEYSAFAWYGSNDWDKWLGARARYDAQNGVSRAKTSVLGIQRIDIRDRSASVVLDSSLAYEKGGRMVRERGIEAFSLGRFGERWLVEGYARLSAGEIAQGPGAKAVLESARALVRSLNTDRVVPTRLVDTVLIEDDLQDWQRSGPGGDVQDPRMAPLMAGDPDLQIVLGRPLRLGIGRSDAFVVFSATLQSKTGDAIKGRGRLGLVLGGGNPFVPGVAPWGFEVIAWAPD